MPSKKPDEDTRTQAQKFKDMAREVGADMSEDALDKLIQVAGESEAPTKEEAFQAKREGKAD